MTRSTDSGQNSPFEHTQPCRSPFQSDSEIFRFEQLIRERLFQGFLIVQEADECIVFCDAILESLFGYNNGELNGKQIGLLHTTQPPSPQSNRLIRQQLKEQGHWQGTSESIRKNGTLFWSRITVFRFQGREFERSLIFVYEDITPFITAENDLVAYQAKLEALVAQKTADLTLVQHKLTTEIQTKNKIEAELQAKEQQMKFALEGTEQGIWIWDAKSGLVLPDRNWFKILGFEFDEIDYNLDWWFGHLHPDSKFEFEAAVNRYLEKKTKYLELEYRLLGKQGNWLWFWTRGIATAFDQNGIPQKMIGMHRHITEFKRAEARLKERDEQIKITNSLLTSLIESPSDIIIYALDRSFHYTAFNRAHQTEMKRMLGIEISIGACMLELLPANEGKARIKKNFEIVLAGKRMSLIEQFGNENKQGWYQSSYNPIYNQMGQITGLTVFVSDISEYMTTQEELRKQEQTFRALVENSPDLIIRLDSQIRFVYVNPAFERTTGLSQQDVLGKTGSELKLALKSLGMLQEIATAVIKNGKPQTVEVHHLTNRSETWYQARMVPEVDGSHKVEFVLCLLRDITEIKLSERTLQEAHSELERRVTERTNQLTIANIHLKQEIIYRKHTEDKLLFAKQQAEIANNAKTEFLANVSHELRTPMHHILNYSKFGIDKIKRPREKLLHYFTQIRKTSQRLMFLLNELLDLSKLEAGKMDYRMQKLDVSIIANECIAELSSLIEEKGVVLKTKPYLEQPFAICDGYKIGQVIRNLLSNAIKFTPAGKTIELSYATSVLYSEREPLPALKVTVADQGIGIPAGEIHLVFEKFVQSSNTKTGAGGTGLGLAISRRIIEDHHGRIWATPSPSGGAIFSFLLPIG